MTPDEKQLLLDEQQADEAAKSSPPVPFAQALSGTTQDIAIKFARRVIVRAEEAGIEPGEIQQMRQRMLKWLEVVKAFEVDRLEIRTDEAMNERQKATLLVSMRTELDRARVGIFGSDYV